MQEHKVLVMQEQKEEKLVIELIDFIIFPSNSAKKSAKVFYKSEF